MNCKVVLNAIPRDGVVFIAVPAQFAQQVADKLVKANIKGIWNFAPVKMRVPEDVKIVNEDLSVGLSRLSYYITGK